MFKGRMLTLEYTKYHYEVRYKWLFPSFLFSVEEKHNKTSMFFNIEIWCVFLSIYMIDFEKQPPISM